MDVTDSGIVTKTTCWQPQKASWQISVRSEGIFNSKNPCVWMPSFVAASTTFLVYVTVTGDSASNNPASASVSASSMNEPSCSNTTLRSLRSIGSSQGCFSRSIDFNSRTVAVVWTSRVMTPPSKVFSLTSQDMAPSGRHDLTPWNMRPFIKFSHNWIDV